MDSLLPIALLMIGLAVGGLATWFVFRAKAQNAYDRGRHEAQSEHAALKERLSASQQTISDLKETVGQLERSVDEKQENEMELRTKLGQLLTTIEQERKQAQEKLALVTCIRKGAGARGKLGATWSLKNAPEVGAG